jgi:hypothetical protein
MLLKKIHAKDWKLDGRQEEAPGKMLAVKRKGNLPLTPSRDGPAARTGESRSRRWSRRPVRKNGVCGTCVHQKMPAGQLISEVKKMAGVPRRLFVTALQ